MEDQQITEGRYMYPSGGTFDQVGGSSFRFSCLWTCTMKFSALAVNSSFKSKVLHLPFIRNQTFRFCLIKDSISTFSLHFLRIPTRPSATYKPGEITVLYYFVESGRRPTEVTLFPTQNNVQVRFSVADIPSIHQFIFSDLVIKCRIEMDDLLENNFKVKYQKEIECRSEREREHTVGSCQDVRNLFIEPDHRDVILKGSDFLFAVHGLVLAACSEYFLQKLKKQLPGTKVIFIENVSQTAMRPILTYMYCQKIDINVKNVIEIATHAKIFGLAKLARTCLNFLRFNVNSKNASSVLEIANMYKDSDLKKKALACTEARTIANP